MDGEGTTRHGRPSGSAQAGACPGRVGLRAGRGGALRARSGRGRAAPRPEMLLARGGAWPPALRTEGVQVSVLPMGLWLPSRQGRGFVSASRHSVPCGALGRRRPRGDTGAGPHLCAAGTCCAALEEKGWQVRWRSGRAAPSALSPVPLVRGCGEAPGSRPLLQTRGPSLPPTSFQARAGHQPCITSGQVCPDSLRAPRPDCAPGEGARPSLLPSRAVRGSGC